MLTVETTKMSSKGQVVIPEAIRTRLGLKTGAQFIVVGKHDAVILKAIETPTLSQFGPLLTQARLHARTADMKRADIAKAIARVRSRA
jgi:AbrB family looped-hinge helix DNA binding protein